MPKRTFTLEDVRQLLPELRALTTKAVERVERLMAEIEELPEADPRRDQLIADVNEAIERWTRQVAALELEAKGLWLVDFDNGQGYYCWRYPEQTVEHFHGYEDGFAGRMKIV